MFSLMCFLYYVCLEPKDRKYVGDTFTKRSLPKNKLMIVTDSKLKVFCSFRKKIDFHKLLSATEQLCSGETN